MSKVGIFWFYKNKLLCSGVAVERGIVTFGAVDSPEDHVHYWPELQLLYPELEEREYFELPRGRIVYKKRTKTFAVYLDKFLLKPRIQAALIKEFSLPKSKTRFVADSHYTTGPEDLERLFKD